MGAEDSIEGVSAVSKSQEKSGADNQFQDTMDYSNSSAIQPSFDQVDVSGMKVEETGSQGQITSSENITPVSDKNIDSSTRVASVEGIEKQGQQVNAEIQKAKSQLTQLVEANGKLNPGTEIQNSYKRPLANHLNHVEENLKIASSKAGLEYKPEIGATEGTNPGKRFMQMLTNSEAQIDKLTGQMNKMGASGKIDPTEMLIINQKMHMVQQEIELFTSLLNKALESTKTLLNTQV
jgi:hypothetical protein